MPQAAIDIHAHTVLEEVNALVRDNPDFRRVAADAAALSGAASVARNRHLFETVYRTKFRSVDERIAAMDAMGIDVEAVSIQPAQYHYWADPASAEKIVSAANDGIAALCRSRPNRLVGLGTVALQHPELAVAQLRHAIGKLSLKGVIISSNVNGTELAAPALEPFWSAAEELGALVFIHPLGCTLGERLTPYYFTNLIGNPADTTLALAHLVFAGTLDRHPRLKICAAHGGGYFPMYCGRFDHGWRVRPEAHTCSLAPSAYLRRLWFDSLVFAPEQLRFLIQAVGASQVVLGTDFPFDMGVGDPLARLDAVADLSPSERAAIRGGNAAALLGLD